MCESRDWWPATLKQVLDIATADFKDPMHLDQRAKDLKIKASWARLLDSRHPNMPAFNSKSQICT